MFFPKKINIRVTNHAIKKIEAQHLQLLVSGILDVISNEPSYFFKNSKKDSKIQVPESMREYQAYIMGYKGLRFVFYFNKRINDLLLVSIFENVQRI